MHVIDDIAQNSTSTSNRKTGCNDTSLFANTAASLMSSVVETACEHDSDLDLMRLVNFMDLYRTYLQAMQNPTSELAIASASMDPESDSVIIQQLAGTKLVSFERFVRDTKLLAMAASAACAETGDKVATPAPLMISANHSTSTEISQ